MNIPYKIPIAGSQFNFEPGNAAGSYDTRGPSLGLPHGALQLCAYLCMHIEVLAHAPAMASFRH